MRTAALILLLFASAAVAIPASHIEADIPFLPSHPHFLANTPHVSLPASVDHPDRLFLLGLTPSPDRGSPGWAPLGDRTLPLLLGSHVGDIAITYQDNTVDHVPLIMGFNVWWYEVFADGYTSPFDTPANHHLLDTSLHLKPTGHKPPAAFVTSIQLRQDHPLKSIDLSDDPAKAGVPVLSAATLLSGSHWLSLSPSSPPQDLGPAAVPADIPVINPSTADALAAIAPLRKLLYTSDADLKNIQFPAISPDRPGPHVTFKGPIAAHLLTAEFYANLDDILLKSAGGKYRTSTPGATNFGRYHGIGTWRDGVGWNQNRAWSRDFGPSLIELAHLGFQDRADSLSDYAFKWAHYFPDHHITYPDGTPAPAHWCRTIDTPDDPAHSPKPYGNQENDGHGLLMLGTYAAWLHSPDRAAWAAARWPDITAAAEWIDWQFDHPAASGASRGVLHTESECSRKPGVSPYADNLCSEGLRAYADIADASNHPDAAKRWRDRATQMEAAQLQVYPTGNPTYGPIWKNAFAWSGHYPILGPLMTLADRRGLDASQGSQWDKLNLDSYLYQLHEHAPEPQSWHMLATGYGQCFITESALLLDRMAEASDLVDVLAKLTYDAHHKPFIIPEGVEWTDDHQFWYRFGDLGNGVQQANFFKVLRLLIGIDDNRPDNAPPQILPRLPLSWTELSAQNLPIQSTKLSLTYRHPSPLAYDCTLKLDAPIPNLSLRLGPFPLSTTPADLQIKINNTPTPATLTPHGDQLWIWLHNLPPTQDIHITSASANTN